MLPEIYRTEPGASRNGDGSGRLPLVELSSAWARMANERTVTAELASSVLGQIRASGAEALFDKRIHGPLLAAHTVEGIYDGFAISVRSLNGADYTFLQRITFAVTFPDGRDESYTTFVAKQ